MDEFQYGERPLWQRPGALPCPNRSSRRLNPAAERSVGGLAAVELAAATGTPRRTSPARWGAGAWSPALPDQRPQAFAACGVSRQRRCLGAPSCDSHPRTVSALVPIAAPASRCVTPCFALQHLTASVNWTTGLMRTLLSGRAPRATGGRRRTESSSMACCVRPATHGTSPPGNRAPLRRRRRGRSARAIRQASR